MWVFSGYPFLLSLTLFLSLSHTWIADINVIIQEMYMHSVTDMSCLGEVIFNAIEFPMGWKLCLLGWIGMEGIGWIGMEDKV